MKRWIKLSVSLLVRGWDLCGIGLRRVIGRQSPGTCVVLYYHAVTGEERKAFSRQMDELLRVAKPIPADLCRPLEPGNNYCAVTFDDGFASVIENALPELERRGIPFTVFVPTGSLGTRAGWINNPSHPAYHEVVLSPERLAALRSHALVTIGSHSVSHPDFLELDETEADHELQESKAVLETICNCPVTLFSFPHGRYNRRLVQQAGEARYQRVFTISPRLAFAKPGEFVSGRTAVNADDWSLEFKLKLHGAYRWLAALPKMNTLWLRFPSRKGTAKLPSGVRRANGTPSSPAL